MKKLLVTTMIAAMAFGEGCSFAAKTENSATSADLQALLDKAAARPEKKAELLGKKYRLEKPVRLTAKHSGLKIDGGGAEITGAKKIDGWRESARFKGAWEADLKYGFFVTSIYVNGVRAQCAMLPKNTRFSAHSAIIDGSQYGSREGMYTDAKQGGDILLGLSPEEIKGAYLGSFRNWVQVNVPIKSVERTKDKNIVRVNFEVPLQTSMFRNCKYPNFTIFNIPSALKEPGEFYFDGANSKIYYIPREGEDMRSAEVEFPFVETPFEISGQESGEGVGIAKDITITGTLFRGGSVGYDEKLLAGGKRAILNDSQSAASSIACVKVSRAENIKFIDCEFSKTDSYGLWIADGVKGAEVKGCVVCDTGLGGIKVGVASNMLRLSRKSKVALEEILTKNIALTDNAIYNFGRFSMSGAGILIFDVPGCTVEHNEIFDGFYTGISYGWTWGAAPTCTKDTSISYNKIHDLAFANVNDVGGIYTLGTSPNSRIEGNVIWNIDCLDYGAWGIYNDEGSDGWLISKNYVRNSSKGGYFMHYGKDCKIFNNIIRNCRDYQVGLGRRTPGSYTFERNIVEFASPAVLFRYNSPIERKAAAFNRNIYYKRNDPDFAKVFFKAWQASGQDKDSFVEEIDVDKIIKEALPVEKIGFEPIHVDKAGIRGKLRKKIDELLKDYKYPPIFECKFVSPEVRISDSFEGNMPATPLISGKDALKVLSENGMRFLRIKDTYSNFLPYFYYRFCLDDHNFIKASFKVRLNDKSNLLVELRDFNGAPRNNPRLEIRNAVFYGTPLPKGRWLTVEAVAPNHVNPEKKFDVKIFDGKKLVAEKSLAYKSNDAKFQTLFFIGIGGGSGQTIDIADIQMQPK